MFAIARCTNFRTRCSMHIDLNASIPSCHLCSNKWMTYESYSGGISTYILLVFNNWPNTLSMKLTIISIDLSQDIGTCLSFNLDLHKMQNMSSIPAAVLCSTLANHVLLIIYHHPQRNYVVLVLLAIGSPISFIVCESFADINLPSCFRPLSYSNLFKYILCFAIIEQTWGHFIIGYLSH